MAANQLAADDTKRMAKDMARLSVEDDGEEVVVIFSLERILIFLRCA